jgi:hypothetical protein
MLRVLRAALALHLRRVLVELEDRDRAAVAGSAEMGVTGEPVAPQAEPTQSELALEAHTQEVVAGRLYQEIATLLTLLQAHV